GQTQHTRAGRGDQNGWSGRPRTPRHNLAIYGVVILALEADLALAEQRHHDLQHFLETVDAVVEGDTERIELRLVPTRPQAQDQPPPAYFIQGDRHLGKHGRIAQRGA